MGWYIDNDFKDYTHTTKKDGVTKSSYTFGGLLPNTTYLIQVNIDRTGGPNLAILSAKTETALGKPSKAGELTVTNVTSTSISISMPYVSGADSYIVLWRKASSSYLNTYNNGNSTICTITGLDPYTDYVLNYRGKNSAGDGEVGESVFQKTMDKWYWSFTLEPGSDFILKATEWKNFISAITNTREKKYGLSTTWNKNTDFYIQQGKDFTASMFKEAAENIWSVRNNTAGINSACLNVTSGAKIEASLFVNVQAALNNLIDYAG